MSFSRKFKLNKDAYDTEQNGGTINQYYTIIQSLWEEQDSMSVVPAITQMNLEIEAFIKAMRAEIVPVLKWT